MHKASRRSLQHPLQQNHYILRVKKSNLLGNIGHYASHTRNNYTLPDPRNRRSLLTTLSTAQLLYTKPPSNTSYNSGQQKIPRKDSEILGMMVSYDHINARVLLHVCH